MYISIASKKEPIRMNNLTNALYEFLTKHYIHGILQDPEYTAAIGYAEKKQELLSRQLTEEQRWLLKELLDEITLAHVMEQERLFRAALALSRELSVLVR
jgi:hypothetical protein